MQFNTENLIPFHPRPTATPFLALFRSYNPQHATRIHAGAPILVRTPHYQTILRRVS